MRQGLQFVLRWNGQLTRVLVGDGSARGANDDLAQHGVLNGRLGHWHVTGDKRVRAHKTGCHDGDRAPMDAENLMGAELTLAAPASTLVSGLHAMARFKRGRLKLGVHARYPAAPGRRLAGGLR